MLAADNDAVTTPTEGAPTLQGHIFAVTNQKGGVGKTTTTISLAASLAAMGKQVLVVDIDPQANATSSLGIDKRAQLPSVYECLVEGLHPDKAIIRDNRPGLHLLPASMALAGAEVELVALSAREHRLAHSLRHVASQFDYLLVDCPPSLGLLTLSGLTAAEAVIVPVQCEYLALEGLTQLMETVSLVQQSLNPRLRIGGIVMTMFDVRTNLSQQVVDEVRKYYPGVVFETVVPRSVRLSEAPSFGQTILEYAGDSRGAAAYRALAAEFMGRQNRQELVMEGGRHG